MENKNIWKKIQNGIFIAVDIGKNFIQSKEEKSVEEYLQNAFVLVDKAAEAGVDAVKFQTHNYEDEQLDLNVTSPHFKGSDRYNWVKRNTLSTPIDGFWKPLKKHCEEKGVIFFSTPMSRGAAQILDKVGTDFWKVGSGDILDFVMLDHERNSGKPIVLASGMSTLEETEMALKFIQEKNNQVCLLHCISKYPCPPEELNLKTIEFYQEKFSIPIGFSDHSIGTESAVVAAAMGAVFIEKHFSLSRDLWGSDHKVSLTPEEAKELVFEIRELETDPQKKERLLQSSSAHKYMGIKGKILQEGEAEFRPLFRKSLMAGYEIKAGEILTAEKIYAMRPQAYAGGLPSEKYEEVLGRTVKKDLMRYDPITPEVLI